MGLPILLLAAFFTIGAGFALFKQHDGLASVALFTVGTGLVWSWSSVQTYRLGRFDKGLDVTDRHVEDSDDSNSGK